MITDQAQVNSTKTTSKPSEMITPVAKTLRHNFLPPRKKSDGKTPNAYFPRILGLEVETHLCQEEVI